MPKLKTRKAIAKRFKLTKKGKIKRARAFKGHILTKKSSKRKRFLRGKDLVHRTDAGYGLPDCPGIVPGIPGGSARHRPVARD